MRLSLHAQFLLHCVFTFLMAPAVSQENVSPTPSFTNSPLVVAQEDCRSHFLSRHQAGLSVDKDTRTEQMMFYHRFFSEFEKSLQNVDCRRFLYRVESVFVEGFVVIPKESKAGPLPVIICNRGGNFDKESVLNYDTLTEWQIPLSKQGFIVISSQYRGADIWLTPPPFLTGQDEFGGRDVQDVLGLLPIIQAMPTADPHRLGMMGYSRGGMMSFLAAREMPQLKALVVKAGAINLLDQAKVRPDMDQEVFAKMIPGYAIQKNQALAARTVHEWVEKLPAGLPVLLLHGAKDRNVKVEYSVELANKLKTLARPHKLVVYPNAGHGFGGVDNAAFDEAVSWFKGALQQNRVGQSEKVIE